MLSKGNKLQLYPQQTIKYIYEIYPSIYGERERETGLLLLFFIYLFLLANPFGYGHTCSISVVFVSSKFNLLIMFYVIFIDDDTIIEIMNTSFDFLSIFFRILLHILLIFLHLFHLLRLLNFSKSLLIIGLICIRHTHIFL